MTPAIDITAEQRRTVLALLNQHLPDTTVWACGSRVKRTSRPESDLDLVVFARPEQSAQVAELWEAFEESNLPFQVDLFVWDEVPESFRRHIEAVRVVLIEGQVNAEYIRKQKHGWQEHEVIDLIKSGSLEIGDGYRAKNTELAALGIPFARAGNINNGFQFDDADCFPEENLSQIKNKTSRLGDVVLPVAENIRPSMHSLHEIRGFRTEVACSSCSLPVNISHTRQWSSWPVIPAQAGIHIKHESLWIPACAGMTDFLGVCSRLDRGNRGSFGLCNNRVVFTSKGTVGRFAYVRENTPRFVYSPQLCFWRSLNPELLDSRFLFYWMSGQEFFDQFKEVSGQTDMAEYVSLRDQRRMRITLPSMREQRAIAHILGTLDDKIELNHRMNETLEAMARALFKSWFVDFDPIRAKMDGCDTGLPKPIADLFPDCLADSKCGEIPKGWKAGRLADIAIAPRRNVDPASLDDETLYIGLEHMPRRSIALTAWERAGKVTSNKSTFEKGEVLFGKLRPYFHKVGVAPINGVCSTDIVVIAPKSTGNYSPKFLTASPARAI